MEGGAANGILDMNIWEVISFVEHPLPLDHPVQMWEALVVQPVAVVDFV